MKAFYDEVSERKQMANGARHKKSGSRSKKCFMQTDSMTQGQLKSLHGNVKTYRLGKPMDWKTFTDMPEDLQKEYIGRLLERFGVTNVLLARMFGVTASAVSHKLTSFGIYRQRQKMTASQIEAWEKFEVDR